MINPHKIVCLLCTGLLSLSAAAAPEPTPIELPLMPYPTDVEYHPGELQLQNEWALVLSGATESLPPSTLSRFDQQLKQQTGQILRLDDPPEATSFHIHIDNPLPRLRTSSQLDPQLESYRLQVTSDGIHLRASTHLGVQHGLQTLLQLLADGDSRLPSLRIDDQPRFGWRGLMLDSVRHFFSVETIKRQLDGMTAAKLNIFHWHLTDDQGWRLESRSYPKLHELASHGQYYTREQVREVVAYAAERGIQVLPEIDMPGHSSAIAVAYPQLMSAPGPYQPEDRWGVHKPLLNPADEAVYVFAEAIFREVTELFPFDYVHIGGDEVDPEHWLNNPDIRAFMAREKLDDPEALHAYFNQRLSAILSRLDRKMIGWDEVLHPVLPPTTAVQSWRGPDALGQAAQRGHPAILSTGFYLDQPQPAAYHYRTRFFPENGTTQPAGANEQQSTWSFTLPRKRGAPVTGHFTLIEGAANRPRGFIDFAGKSRQPVHSLRLDGDRIRFALDTWMGPVRARLRRTDTALSGEMIVGNAAYPLSGEAVAQPPTALASPVLTDAQQANILGGEIALWSELIDERSIDLRLWPRAFAVAERLWSPAQRQDEVSLYQRLPRISVWADQSVGLRHREQSRLALRRLVGEELLIHAQTLVEALEPAQYYHRHHEKSVHETYSRRDPLDRLADSLSAESLATRTLTQQIEQLLANPRDEALASAIETRLKNWRNSARTLQAKLKPEGQTAELHRQAQRVQILTDWGLQLLPLWRQHRSLDVASRATARERLRETQMIVDEIVVAAAYPIEELLEAIPEPPTTIDWMPDGSFTSGIEGPVVGPDGALYAVNFARQGSLGKVTGQGRGELWINLPEGSIANSLRFDSNGLLWAADYTEHNLLQIDPRSGRILARHHQPRMHQPNDIAITRWGAIFASDPDWANNRGQLWRMDPDGTFTLLETDMGTTNGIELSPDEQRLYVNESVQRRVWVYRVSATGELSDKRLFYQFDDYGLDGMATDPEGKLYIARYGAGEIAVLSPAGKLIKTVPLKGRYPTNIALDFGRQPRAFVTLQARGAIEMFELESPTATATAPVAELLSREQFDALFPQRNPFYSYEGLLAASRQFPAFAGHGDRETRLRELAAALANFAHETGNLVYVEEIHKGDYCSDSTTLCGICAEGKQYFGRGPIQLSWNGNYCAAGLALGIDLWANPERVAEDPAVAWQTALWYWLTRRGPGTMTAHRAMLDGHGFGETIRSINGRLECGGGNPNQVDSRVRQHQRILEKLGASPGDNLRC